MNSLPITLRATQEFLTFFDAVRFCKYLALLYKRTELKPKIKNEQLLVLLKRDRFGTALRDTA